jgi:hypothetical protein
MQQSKIIKTEQIKMNKYYKYYFYTLNVQKVYKNLLNFRFSLLADLPPPYRPVYLVRS